MSETSPVESSTSSESRPVGPRGRAIRLLVAALAAAAAAAAVASWRAGPSPARRAVRPLEVVSPYANARPGVAYVGDAACARCHADIAADYRRHPMGRSLAPIAEAPGELAGPADGRPLFEAGGLQYSIERRDGRVFHREMRRDAAGRIVASNEAEVQYVLGSGSQGASFLVDRDGFLFQSPIGWYAHGRGWDLSPGYRDGNLHFDRPVQSTCLYCHANRFEPVEGTTNRYRLPTVRGHAIGCERCHGPGELHVRRPGGAGGSDPTIVNPASLEAPLRDAVCEQCHLMGEARILKVDRREEDFRPGLPFDLFWSVFEGAERGEGGGKKFVGQVEQMYESVCYRASAGRLGCLSCHDPHRWTAPEERAEHYRGRCLECHGEGRGCRLPEPARRARGDDCIACHMPRLGRSDIPHVAATDHRIPRDPGAAGRPAPDDGARGDGLPMVAFRRESAGDRGGIEAGRDLGVALYTRGQSVAAAALPLLEAAAAARPDDVVAWQALGLTLGQLGRPAEGLTAFRKALAVEPDRESIIVGAAGLAALAGKPGEAITARRRAIALNPWRASYRSALAALCFQEKDWSGAEAACREALRLNAFDLEVRKLLVRSLLHLGRRGEAGEELRVLLDLGPPDRDELIRRFPGLAPAQ